MIRCWLRRCALLVGCATFAHSATFAQEPTIEPGPVAKQVREGIVQDPTEKVLLNDVDKKGVLYAKLERMLTGAKLVGHFTVDGRPMTDLKEETYEIAKLEKLPEGEKWIVTARIKYGDVDMKVPVPLDIEWAGRTPVMTMDNMTIPLMGTFSTRVVFHANKYAGTWQHDNVGGHLFGRVEGGNEMPEEIPEEAKVDDHNTSDASPN